MLETIDRVTLPFLIGFGLNLSAIIISFLYLFLYESVWPIKNKIYSYLILTAHVFLAFSLVLEYNFILYSNQIALPLLDPLYLSQAILYLSFLFFMLHYLVIGKGLFKGKEYSINMTILTITTALMTSGLFIFDLSSYYNLYLISTGAMVLVNFWSFMKTSPYKLFIIVFLGLLILSLFIYVMKIGFIFGITFNSFQFLNFVNTNKAFFLLAQPLIIVLNFAFFNYFVTKSYSSLVDMENSKNVIRLNKDNLRKRAFHQ